MKDSELFWSSIAIAHWWPILAFVVREE
jgi:hypothetical protein